MISVSLCMIVKNEEDVLERCLKSVAGLVDEIIIVDTGSTDRTREIATHFTNQIFDFPWQDDFSAARNEAFSCVYGLLHVAGCRRRIFGGGSEGFSQPKRDSGPNCLGGHGPLPHRL